MVEGREKTTCTVCGDIVRQDRVNDKGVCVNCLALGREGPGKEGEPSAAEEGG